MVRDVLGDDRAGADLGALPIVVPGRMVALLPMEACRLTRVGMTTQSFSDCSSPVAVTAPGYRSLVNMTPWPMNTPSSMVTPSQMKEWLDILQLRPIELPFWISTKVPMRAPSPMVQP